MEKFTITVPGAELTVYPRRPGRRWRDYTAAPRMYVSVTDESILDNLANRRRRPYNVYKTLLRDLRLWGILDLGKLTWSQHAGCSMCPCSPGFILPHQEIRHPEGKVIQYFDVWVTLDNAPSVDERKAPRVLVGV